MIPLDQADRFAAGQLADALRVLDRAEQDRDAGRWIVMLARMWEAGNILRTTRDALPSFPPDSDLARAEWALINRSRSGSRVAS